MSDKPRSNNSGRPQPGKTLGERMKKMKMTALPIRKDLLTQLSSRAGTTSRQIDDVRQIDARAQTPWNSDRPVQASPALAKRDLEQDHATRTT
jgi:hypothetical protein